MDADVYLEYQMRFLNNSLLRIQKNLSTKNMANLLEIPVTKTRCRN